MEPKPSTTSLSQVSAVGTTIENLSHRTLVEEQIDKIISSKSLTESNDNHWMPDKLCRECSNCNVKFSIIVRRHHCRVCGRIYCHGCSNHTIPGHLFRSSLKGNVRVCSACEKIFYEVINARQNQNNPSQLMQPIPMSSLASSDHTDDQDTSSLASTASNLYTSSMNRWSDMESHESNVAGSPSASIGIEFDNPTPHRHTSVARKSDLSVVASENDDETILAIAEDEVKLRLQEIWNKFLDKSTGLMSQTHRYRLKNIPNSWTAQEIIEWLLRSNLASSREMAVYIGQAFLQTRCLKVVSSHDQHFKDSKDVILEIGEAGTLVTPTVTFADAPNWFLSDEGEETTVANSRTSIHESKVDLETGLATFRRKRLSAMFSTSPDVTNDSPNSSIPIIIPPVDEEKAQEIDIDNPPSFDKGSTTPGDYIIPPSLTLESIQPSLTSYSILDKEAVNHAMTSVNGLSKASQATKKFEELPVFKEIKRTHMISHEKHFDAILSQQLKAFGLSYRWLDFIKPLIQEACQKISTNVTLNDFMDIRVYCKVKKVAGGHISDCSYVPGVVFTKHVTHKKMDMSLKNPRVLLLKCAFEFQRKENQLSSFDTLLSQECEYLKNLIERVKKFKPSIMFVQKSVSRYALEMLHNHGIVVVVNIKPSVMSRLARCTQGDLILNLDQLYFDVKLGTCGHFYVRTFTVDSGIRKTLMYLDDCDPKLGGVILLKGRARNVLKRVKSVVSLGLQVAHNMNLESSYLSDIFASHSSSEDDHIDDDDYLVTPAITPTQSLYRFSPSMLNDVDSFAALEDENEEMASALSQSLSACSIDVVEEQQYVVADEAEPVPDENEIKCENDQLLAVENDDNDTDSVDFDKPPMQQLTSAEVFHRILSSHIISTSPNMEFPVPYLQTERGLLADVRYYLPKDIYWSRYFQPKSKSSKSILPSAAVRPCMLTSSNSFSDVSFNHNYKSVSCHPFTSAVFLHSPNSNQFKAALADFRARAFIVDESTDGFFFDSAKRSANIYKVLGEIFKSSHEFEKRAGNLVTDQVMANEIAVVKDTPHSQDVQNDISNSEINRCDKAMPILATTTEWHDGSDKLDNDSDEGEDDDGNGKRQELDLPQGFPGMSDDVTLPGVSATTEWSFLMEEQILPNSDRLDCLDPFNHQFLSLIFSSTCSSETTQKQSYPCVLPW
jgi:1-phosphatidylinositol-3-phosphate 5-kinase